MLSTASYVLACWLVLCMAPSLWAHPFHISTAEIEYHAPTARLQVSVKVQATDIERAVARMTGQRFQLEQADAAERLSRYLAAGFYVSVASDDATAEQTSKLHWVGSELKGAWLWCYFELELPVTDQPLQLVDKLLCEVNDAQINTLSVRFGQQRASLKLTQQQPSTKFMTQWLNP